MSGPYENRTLICSDCQEEFVFTADAQEWWYDEKGFTDDPKRCRSCNNDHQKEKRARRQGSTTHGNHRQPPAHR